MMNHNQDFSTNWKENFYLECGGLHNYLNNFDKSTDVRWGSTTPSMAFKSTVVHSHSQSIEKENVWFGVS